MDNFQISVSAVENVGDYAIKVHWTKKNWTGKCRHTDISTVLLKKTFDYELRYRDNEFTCVKTETIHNLSQLHAHGSQNNKVNKTADWQIIRQSMFGVI